MTVIMVDLKKCNFGLFKRPTQTGEYNKVKKEFWWSKFCMVKSVVESGNVDQFVRFLKWGLDIRWYTWDSQSFLNFVVSRKQESVARFLLQNWVVAADLAQPANLGKNAQSLASRVVFLKKEWVIAQFIDRNSESPSAGDGTPDSIRLRQVFAALSVEAVFELCLEFSEGAVTRLLMSGMPYTSRHPYTGETLVHAAVRRRDCALLRWMLSRVSATQPSLAFEIDSDRQTALQCALRSTGPHRDAKVELLLEWATIARHRGIDFHGDETLVIAARYGDTSAVRKLIELGCDASYTSPDRDTALHSVIRYMSAQCGQLEAFDQGCEIIELLVRHGARWNAPGTAGQLPWETLTELCWDLNDQVCEFLEERPIHEASPTPPVHGER
ncbi:Ankyrin repeat-containing domain-containing protein [Aspergillus oryzae]|uniref:Ankyrin repeat-containing domain-containing protein n=1 Tax=Aspergillus oryzae TaxID=5062 RepID=A0A1S9D482_ASPOZ|nr:Ankyrin repeat-containing domain-containing protein [Aspergillus oryzae]